MYVRHDPFARGAYRRFPLSQRTIASYNRCWCDWCGQKADRLYAYVWEPDDRQDTALPIYANWYCNFACFTSHSH